MSLREDINQFIEHFQMQNKEIATLEACPIFRKVLYLITCGYIPRRLRRKLLA
ncbi:MAG: hypothetical protein NPIRA06_15950 [Nitrospirales bacterium]|nr:MAG: hypothetical protein NPIRA06_15950 [Nitrospirales bacterium]